MAAVKRSCNINLAPLGSKEIQKHLASVHIATNENTMIRNEQIGGVRFIELRLDRIKFSLL